MCWPHIIHIRYIFTYMPKEFILFRPSRQKHASKTNSRPLHESILYYAWLIFFSCFSLSLFSPRSFIVFGCSSVAGWFLVLLILLCGLQFFNSLCCLVGKHTLLFASLNNVHLKAGKVIANADVVFFSVSLLIMDMSAIGKIHYICHFFSFLLFFLHRSSTEYYIEDLLLSYSQADKINVYECGMFDACICGCVAERSQAYE